MSEGTDRFTEIDKHGAEIFLLHLGITKKIPSWQLLVGELKLLRNIFTLICIGVNMLHT
jgi:hypothetical protein